MKIAEGRENTVRLQCRSEILLALFKVDRICRQHLGYEACITSANDGKHSVGSKHYSGDAVDIRMWTSETSKTMNSYSFVVSLAKIIQSELGYNYDVVPEHTHIHIEYHPKGVL